MLGLFKKEKAAPVLLQSLTLFGKLPGMADYTRVNAHLDHAVMINTEIDRMITVFHEEGSNTLNSLDMQCVIQHADHWLVTQVCHSRDLSGRSYPFTGVAFVGHPLIKACQPALPVILAPFADYLNTLKETITSKAGLEMSLKNAGQLRFEHTLSSLLESEIDLLKQLSQAQFLSEAFPGQSKQDIAAQIIEAGRNIVSFKSAQPIPLFFVLSPKNTLISMTLWLQWIEGLLQPKRWPINYCMVKTDAYAHLHVWFQPVIQYGFAQWVRPIPLPRETVEDTSQLISILSKDELTLCDAMYQWQQEVVRVLAQP